ncbi:DgyrCDS12113 [Dimorphilus gyrociliatus]|uniref:DgyrCDS12113 n=1 Tax=Dimorphilus gyrociliatus TaxID=2664684 RepID=A0A7I8W6R5_9ANNE|nr:DgyrCDS12113 [Dimorphilus gyrociliatus]
MPLDSVLVECPNKNSGCKVKLKTKDVEYHEENCDFSTIECEGCHKELKRKDLRQHEKIKRCVESKLKRELIKATKGFNDENKQHILKIKMDSAKRTGRQLRQYHNRLHEKIGFSPRVPSATRRSPQFFFSTICKRCNRSFNDTTNHSSACTWHEGPILPVFGTCQACGRLDYQIGCIAGEHS